MPLEFAVFAVADIVMIWFAHVNRLGVPADSVSTQDREKTKRLVYSVVYGVGKSNYMIPVSISTLEINA